jgi:hypothetical protein
MRDTCKPYRLAMFNCLNGHLGGINVYDEKKKRLATDTVFVLLSTQQETPIEDNDCAFITKSSIDIEIVTKTGFEVTKDTADDLANLIMQLVIPDTQSSGLTAPSGFQFLIPQCTRTLTRNVSITDSESILVKILTFTTQIITQS